MLSTIRSLFIRSQYDADFLLLDIPPSIDSNDLVMHITSFDNPHDRLSNLFRLSKSTDWDPRRKVIVASRQHPGLFYQRGCDAIHGDPVLPILTRKPMYEPMNCRLG